MLGDVKPALSCTLLISRPRTAFISSLRLSHLAHGWWPLAFCPLPLVFFSPGPSLQALLALLPSSPSEPLLHPPQISEHTWELCSSHLCCQPLLGLLELYGSVRPRPGGRGRVRPGPAKVGTYSLGGSTVGRDGGPVARGLAWGSGCLSPGGSCCLYKYPSLETSRPPPPQQQGVHLCFPTHVF